ncbi:triacylglycerol lipase OBL1 isoform X2 [Lotus japonicus]|uniref:triacylglycerol lipase OBL1 isoform X2 n=1 Tax=Lotus japonicus TaxID=34305 RepID=UPI0025832D4D|nr:triacylglycerol lipase OBL1 isoform X2 [Lotus japonicus]
MDHGSSRYLNVFPDKGGIWDLMRYALLGDISTFVDTNNNNLSDPHHRWIIFLSILVRKIIAFLAKPLYWTGCFLEFLLNLLSQNGNFFGLLHNLIRGNLVVPQRGSEAFISIVGHLDNRIDLHEGQMFTEFIPEMGNRALMDLCVMASKLAYENALVIKNIMHFVDFYNCWNDFQKEMSTQVFIMCDKAKDANLILVSFRGTEPFDADDWSTDFDYSWYEIPETGKVHMGFLEALGLGNRVEPSTFTFHLLGKKNRKSSSTDDADIGASSESLFSGNDDSDADQSQYLTSETPSEMTAYYTVKSKLKSLLLEHKNANFMVTGHSLGGALAILFPTVLVVHEEMEIMERLLGVYTFGQPRIGNRQLGRFMEAYLERKYFRVVYCNDLVPRLPYDDKTFLYKHFGACLYYNCLYIEKQVKEEPNKNFFQMRSALSIHLNAVWELIRGIAIGYVEGAEYKEGWLRILARVIGIVFAGFSAHCSTDYVNSVRLGKKSSPQMSPM